MFNLSPGRIVAAVGGADKTSLVFSLAADAARRGLPALATSTVKFRPPRREDFPAPERCSEDALPSRFADITRDRGFCALVSAEADGRASGFTPAAISALAPENVGLIAVQADGSRGMPLKAPDRHEPAMPAAATDVIVCAGLAVLGKPLDVRSAHRPELVGRLANAAAGVLVTADIIFDVINSEEGGRRLVPPGARLHALFDEPPGPDHQRLAEYIGQRLVYAGFERAVVATARTGEVHSVVR